MKKEFLEVGKIVGTHGVRGMVRIQAWCDSNEVFCTFKKVFTDNLGKNPLKIDSAKPHSNVVIAKLNGIDTIEQAETLRNKIVYASRNDFRLEKGQYFIQDLIGINVFDADKNELLGKISDVSQTGANDVWHIMRDDTEYLIPVIDEVVVSVDIDNEIIKIHPLKGIFSDED